LGRQKKKVKRPAVSVNFSYNVNDKSVCLIEATVKNTKTGISSTYYLTAWENKSIIVGHGMCTGAFVLADEQDYEVTFVLVDASGNKNNAAKQVINFKSPSFPKG
jgi:hypothetical protein